LDPALRAYVESGFAQARIAGALIDPEFKQNYTDSVLKPVAKLLESVHDYIVKQGLTRLSPGPVTYEKTYLSGLTCCRD
jgi:hypothetical protein